MLLLIAEGLDVYQPLGAMISSAYYSTLLLCGRFHRRPVFSPVEIEEANLVRLAAVRHTRHAPINSETFMSLRPSLAILPR
jgi:hypothetical protein